MDIRIFAMDVDGTLTDGKIYMGDHGEVMKAFNVKDGQGIFALERAGIVTAIITVRDTKIVENRAKELGMREIYQGRSDKVGVLRELCAKYDVQPEEIAYIGDDLGDLKALRFCGLSACPADAAKDVKSECDYVCKMRGGEGCVREFAEFILENY